MDWPGIELRAATYHFSNCHSLYNIDFIPHTEESMFPLENPIGECCIGKQSLLIVNSHMETKSIVCSQ